MEVVLDPRRRARRGEEVVQGDHGSSHRRYSHRGGAGHGGQQRVSPSPKALSKTTSVQWQARAQPPTRSTYRRQHTIT